MCEFALAEEAFHAEFLLLKATCESLSTEGQYGRLDRIDLPCNRFLNEGAMETRGTCQFRGE